MFSWDPNIGSIGGGGWILHVLADPPDIPTDVYFDMTTASSYQHPLYSDINQKVEIMTYDAYLMRSFPPESLALAKTEKGKEAKGKGIKKKAKFSEATFTLVNNTGQKALDLHLKFSQEVRKDAFGDPILSISGGMSGGPKDPAKPKEWNFTGNVADSGSVIIYAQGNKGKELTIKSYEWTSGVDEIGEGTALPDPGTSHLYPPMPNVWNALDEVYQQGGQIYIDSGLYVGRAPNQVYHPKKAAAIYKTLKDKTGMHTGGPSCLNTIGGKPWTKPQKSAPPAKHNNILLAEAIALKANIAMSDEDKMPGLFGDMKYNNPGNLFDGQTVRQIAAKADNYLACLGLDKGDSTSLLAVIQEINREFDGPLDTISFAGGTKSPPSPQGGHTKFTGHSAVGLSQHLYRPTAVIPPAPERRPFVDIASLPQAFSLRQNYPNPFNPATAIEFTLPQDAIVTMKVYNMLGQEVATLADREEFTEGLNDVEFDASELSSGVYFYRIAVEGIDEDGNATERLYTSVKKMMLVK
ncbi:MAG: T9SS type A sorting domain-containing protein [Ignavibacteriae bacterium]|nr:T9SS type A sorting domain-containing protein [Ignavibacteriota bacterium]